MFTRIKSKTAALAAVGVLAASTAGGIAVGGCGGNGSAAPSAETTRSSPGATQPNAPRNPVPRGLLAAESGAEDTIDFALAGQSSKAIASASALNDAARGQAAADLAAAGVSEAQIAELKARAAEVARLAPSANPLQTALAANRAFELVSGFFGLYEDVVPAEVVALDYLDFEAKLQALAGDRPAAERAVSKLAATWAGLRSPVSAAGGGAAVASFDAHVQAMQDRIATGTDKQIADEAQHGLDLVDEIEVVYTG